MRACMKMVFFLCLVALILSTENLKESFSYASLPFSSLLDTLEKWFVEEKYTNTQVVFLTNPARISRLRASFVCLVRQVFPGMPGCYSLVFLPLSSYCAFLPVKDLKKIDRFAYFQTKGVFIGSLLPDCDADSQILPYKMPFDGRLLGNLIEDRVGLKSWIFFLKGRASSLPSNEHIRFNLNCIGVEEKKLAFYEKRSIRKKKVDVLLLLLCSIWASYYLKEPIMEQIVSKILAVEKYLKTFPLKSDKLYRDKSKDKMRVIRYLPKPGTIIYKEQPLYTYHDLDKKNLYWDVPVVQVLSQSYTFILWSSYQQTPFKYNRGDGPLILAFKFTSVSEDYHDLLNRVIVIAKNLPKHIQLDNTMSESEILAVFEKSKVVLKTIAAAKYNGINLSEVNASLA